MREVPHVSYERGTPVAPALWTLAWINGSNTSIEISHQGGSRGGACPATRPLARTPRTVPAHGVQGFRLRVWDLGFGVGGLWFGVWDLGFGVWVWGFGVSGLLFRVWSLGFGVWSLRFGAWGLWIGVESLEFRIQGLGFGFWGSECVDPTHNHTRHQCLLQESMLARRGWTPHGRANALPHCAQ